MSSNDGASGGARQDPACKPIIIQQPSDTKKATKPRGSPSPKRNISKVTRQHSPVPPSIRVTPSSTQSSLPTLSDSPRRKSAPSSPNNSPPLSRAARYLTPQASPSRHVRRGRSFGGSKSDKQTAAVENIKISVRIRPLLAGTEKDERKVISSTEHGVCITDEQNVQRDFQFDAVFDDTTSADDDIQLLVYKKTAQPLLNCFLDGFNCSLLAYGQTGSGKTYSISGTQSSPGILPHFCEEMFAKLEQSLKESRTRIEMAYFEIYQEQVFDLLSTAKKQMKVREHPKTGIFVEGLTFHAVDTYKKLQEYLKIGLNRRATASTGMNEQSSRSHSLFQIKLTQIKSEELDGNEKSFECTSVATIVDLAGSERSNQAQQYAQDAEKRHKETVAINLSLTTLKNVITLLSQNQRKSTGGFANYRDSILTLLLKDSLGGNARTSLLATVSPLSSQKEESLSTLRFASIAAKVVTRAKVNDDGTLLIIKRVKELEKLLAAQSGTNVDAKSAIEVNELKSLLDDKEKQMKEQKEEFLCKLQASETARLEAVNQLKKNGVLGHFGDHGDGDHLIELNVDPELRLVFQLDPYRAMTGIGSDAGCDIVLEGSSINNFHCELVKKDDQLLLMPRTSGAVYINGKQIHEVTKLAHLDRICIGGERFFLVLLNNERLAEIDSQYNYHFAKLEVVQEKLQSMNTETTERLANDFQQEQKEAADELKFEIEEKRREQKEIELKLKEAQQKQKELEEKLYNAVNQKQDLIGKNSRLVTQLDQSIGIITKLRKEIDESKKAIETAEQFEADLKEAFEASNESFLSNKKRNPLLASTAIDVEQANVLLSRLDKDKLFEFQCEELPVKDDEEETKVVVYLINKKQGICCELDLDQFKHRYQSLTAIYVSVDRNECDYQPILYNRKDCWERTCDNNTSNLMSTVMLNALKSTAKKRTSTVGEVKSLIRRSSLSMAGNKKARRSTLTRIIESTGGSENTESSGCVINPCLYYLSQNKTGLELNINSIGLPAADQIIFQCASILDDLESLKRTVFAQNTIVTAVNLCNKVTARIGILEALALSAVKPHFTLNPDPKIPSLGCAALDLCENIMKQVGKCASTIASEFSQWKLLKSKLMDAEETDGCLDRMKVIILDLVSALAGFMLTANSVSLYAFKAKLEPNLLTEFLSSFMGGYCAFFQILTNSLKSDQYSNHETSVSSIALSAVNLLDVFVKILDSFINEGSCDQLKFTYEKLCVPFAQPIIQSLAYLLDAEFCTKRRQKVFRQTLEILQIKLNEEFNIELDRKFLPLSAVVDDDGKPMKAYDWLDENLQLILDKLNITRSSVKSYLTNMSLFYTPIQSMPSDRRRTLDRERDNLSQLSYGTAADDMTPV